MLARPWLAVVWGTFLALAITACGGGGSGGGNPPTENTQNDTSTPPPQEVRLKAWIGPYDTKVSFPSEALGLDFYRSSDKNCDLGNYSVCPLGQLAPLTTTQITDTTITGNRAGWYWLKKSSATSLPMEFVPTPLPGRAGHQTVAFKGRLWVIGGSDGNEPQNDIWTSEDGLAWRIANRNTPFQPRYGHRVVVHNNKL